MRYGPLRLSPLTGLSLTDQVNAGGLIRHLEERALEPFIPTRSPEAIALDAEVVVATSARRGLTRGLKDCPRTLAFIQRQAL